MEVAAGGSLSSGTEQQRTKDRLQEDEGQAQSCLGAEHLKRGRLEDLRGKEGIPVERRCRPPGSQADRQNACSVRGAEPPRPSLFCFWGWVGSWQGRGWHSLTLYL